MPALAVQIVRFVDESQPGWVECELVDASGRCHVLRDKVPIFTSEPLDASTAYPQPGVAACEVLARWEDDQGRKLARVTIDRPFGIASSEGLSELVVLASQLAPSAGEAAADSRN